MWVSSLFSTRSLNHIDDLQDEVYVNLNYVKVWAHLIGKNEKRREKESKIIITSVTEILQWRALLQLTILS